MADSAIAPVPIQDDTAPAVRVARLSGEWFRDSAIDNTIMHQLVVAVGAAVQGEDYQQRR
jgi:hypothetical protein